MKEQHDVVIAGAGPAAGSVSPDGSSVRVAYREDGAEKEAAGAFAVGCDGARSRVRETLGASFDGITYKTRAALADLTLDQDEEVPFPRLTTRGGLAVGIRITSSIWRLILPFAAGDALPPDERVARATRALFPFSEDYESVWQSEFRLHRRLSSRFVRGRLALAGDAAHLNSPVGGQGMNAGIQDAEALTEALVRALDAGDPEPLHHYGAARRKAIEGGVNAFTDRLTRLLLLGGGRFVKPALRMARAAFALPPVRKRVLRRIAMLDGSRSDTE